ncbi:hypothetical protein GF373_15020 [bacterium]|nr:hypothetical protein [bacterium]
MSTIIGSRGQAGSLHRGLFVVLMAILMHGRFVTVFFGLHVFVCVDKIIDGF